ncbi:MAG TPA: phage holin family protein [Rubricoccaceae bacterium]|jgi:hypothetical protein
MPDPSTRLPAPDPDARRVDTAHQLPPHRGKVGRVADHLAALSVDAREWVELRIDLVKAEITEKKDEVVESVERKAIGAAFLAVAGVVALYALGFLLSALATGLGWALANGDGSDVLRPLFFGLGIVTLLLFAVAGVLAIIGKGRLEAASAIDARLKVPDYAEDNTSTPGRPTRHQIQELEAAHARQTTT